MNFDLFQNFDRRFSVVLFVQQHDLDVNRKQIEDLGRQSNLKLVVQPCPYEGIEFLYRVSVHLPGHTISLDDDIFWQDIEIGPKISEAIFSEVSRHHIEYLLAIIEQDTKKMIRERKILESLVQL